MKGFVTIVAIVLMAVAVAGGTYIVLNENPIDNPIIMSPPQPIPLGAGDVDYDCSGADFCFNTTAEIDTSEWFKNTTSETNRYNQTANNIQMDFPYAVKDANLKSYWRLDDSTFEDQTGAFAGSGNGITSVAGIFGNAANFETNDDITFGAAADWKWMHYSVGNDFTWTICQWFNLANAEPDDLETLTATMEVSTASTGIVIFIDDRVAAVADKSIRLFIGRGVAGQGVLVGGLHNGAYPDLDNTWIHYCWTYDQALANNNAKLYVNGSYVGSDSKTAFAPSAANPVGTLTFGETPASAWELDDGSLDETKIYDRVLTATEIEELYNGGKQYIDSTQATVGSEWHSPEMTVPAGKQLKNITLNITNTDATAYIDYIILVNSTNTIKYFNDTNIQTDTIITYINMTYGSCDFGCINESEKYNLTIGWEGDGSDTAIVYYAYGFYETVFPPEAPIVDIILPVNQSYLSGGGFWHNITMDNYGDIGEADWCGLSINGAANISMTWEAGLGIGVPGIWYVWHSIPSNNYRDIFCCNSTAGYGAVMNCSANVNYTIEDPTSLYAVEFEINDTIFATTDYTEIFFKKFNTTTKEAFGLMSSFNLQKLTGGGTSVVSARIYVDEVLEYQENVRTIINNNRQGSTGVAPLTFNLTEGTHNLSLELARTGNGNVEISNINFVLGKFNTSDIFLVRGQLININYTYNSSVWSEGYNWTIDKTISSPTYHGGKLNVRATGQDDILLNLTNWNTSENSPLTLRHISNAIDLGSVGLSFINMNESDSHNMTIGSRNSEGENITILGSVFDFDLRDAGNNYVNNFQTNNTSISEETPMIITGADYQLIDSAPIRLYAGNGLFMSMSISFNSSSNFHTSTFKINVTNATCPDKIKERYLESNDDMGNAFIYSICNNFELNENVTVNLWGASELGETIQISAVSLSAMEVTNFSLAALGIPPAISIQQPDAIEITNDIWFNVSTNQDNTDQCWLNLDGNSTVNQTMTNATGNWYNLTEDMTNGIHFVHFFCNNTDGLLGETDDWYFFIGTNILGFEAGIGIGLFILTFTLIYIFIGFCNNWKEDLLSTGFKILYLGLALSFIVASVWILSLLSGTIAVTNMLNTITVLMIAINTLFMLLYLVFAIKYIISEIWGVKIGKS